MSSVSKERLLVCDLAPTLFCDMSSVSKERLLVCDLAPTLFCDMSSVSKERLLLFISCLCTMAMVFLNVLDQNFRKLQVGHII